MGAVIVVVGVVAVLSPSTKPCLSCDLPGLKKVVVAVALCTMHPFVPNMFGKSGVRLTDNGSPELFLESKALHTVWFARITKGLWLQHMGTHTSTWVPPQKYAWHANTSAPLIRVAHSWGPVSLKGLIQIWVVRLRPAFRETGPWVAD